nr:DUF2284 domain-containing protein [Candidatus Sigynarchaeota archaeon]
MKLLIKRVDLASIAFLPSEDAVRESCTRPFAKLDAGCPYFGTSWSCPPNRPPLPEMKARLASCHDFFLVVLQESLPAGFKENKGLFKEVQKTYGKMDGALESCLDALHHFVPGSVPVYASPCKVCMAERKKPCTCPGKPCRFPDRIQYSLSSYGIDTLTTVKNAGIPIEVNPETVVSRVGMICAASPASIDAMIQHCVSCVKGIT